MSSVSMGGYSTVQEAAEAKRVGLSHQLPVREPSAPAHFFYSRKDIRLYRDTFTFRIRVKGNDQDIVRICLKNGQEKFWGSWPLAVARNKLISFNNVTSLDANSGMPRVGDVQQVWVTSQGHQRKILERNEGPELNLHPPSENGRGESISRNSSGAQAAAEEVQREGQLIGTIPCAPPSVPRPSRIDFVVSPPDIRLSPDAFEIVAEGDSDDLVRVYLRNGEVVCWMELALAQIKNRSIPLTNVKFRDGTTGTVMSGDVQKICITREGKTSEILGPSIPLPPPEIVSEKIYRSAEIYKRSSSTSTPPSLANIAPSPMPSLLAETSSSSAFFSVLGFLKAENRAIPSFFSPREKKESNSQAMPALALPKKRTAKFWRAKPKSNDSH